MHRLAAEELADGRAQHRASVGRARVGRRPGPFELDVVPPALRIDRFAQQERAAVAKLRHEVSELMTRIGCGNRLGAFRNRLTRKNLRQGLRIKPGKIKPQRVGERLVQRNQTRRGDADRPNACEKTLR